MQNNNYKNSELEKQHLNQYSPLAKNKIKLNNLKI